MKRLLAARATMAATLGVALVIVAAGAYALASGGGTITACVHKHGGALYVAKRCAKKDRKLTWNKVGPTGPQGAKGGTGLQGPKGETGAAGPVGPTFGTVSSDEPPALTESSQIDTTLLVNLPAAGPLWVQAHFDPIISCSGGCEVFFGIYVDGSPVHGSRRILHVGFGPPIESWGVSAPVSAGSHTIRLEYTPSGEFESSEDGVTPELGGILLGSS